MKSEWRNVKDRSKGLTSIQLQLQKEKTKRKEMKSFGKKKKKGSSFSELSS